MSISLLMILMAAMLVGFVGGTVAHRIAPFLAPPLAPPLGMLVLLAAMLVSLVAGTVVHRIAPPLAPPSAPLLRPFGDNKDWVVSEDVTYQVGDTADYIVVPKGFVTDFASIPQALWSFGLSPHGQYSRAAVIHDYLYWAQGCSRDQADRLMVIAMKESDVGKFNERVIYSGVKAGGGSAWDSNAAERSSGLPRIVPTEYLKPEDPNLRWPEYRQFLVDRGVRDPNFDRSPAYCSYGNTTQVPRVSLSAPLSRE